MIRILIADDNALSLRLTRRTLEHAGFEVVSVESGSAAAERLTRGGAPRLALLDWDMPGLNGPEVCRVIRNHPDLPYTYIILLTSKESKDDLIAGLEAGADDYLTKPCDAGELRARLRTGQRILQRQDKLFHDARHDSLTRLPNRASFLDRLTKCVQRASHDGDYKFAVLFVDLDHFKAVNDSLGHLAGDELITQVAERLTRSIRRKPVSPESGVGPTLRQYSDDILARLGGDEFTVLLDDIREAADATAIATRIEQALARPFTISGRRVKITGSIGVSVRAAGFSHAKDMLRDADAAMYRAKAKATGSIFLSHAAAFADNTRWESTVRPN